MGWLRVFSFDPKTLTGANSIAAHIVELANMLRSGAVAFGYRAQVLALGGLADGGSSLVESEECEIAAVVAVC